MLVKNELIVLTEVFGCMSDDDIRSEDKEFFNLPYFFIIRTCFFISNFRYSLLAFLRIKICVQSVSFVNNIIIWTLFQF